MNIYEYLGYYVDIELIDGQKYSGYITDVEDADDSGLGEDSFDIDPIENGSHGVTLPTCEIETISINTKYDFIDFRGC